MKNILRLALCFTILIATSCKDDAQSAIAGAEESQTAMEADLEQFQYLKDEAMEVHDEVMPEMGTLMELSERMDAQIEKNAGAEEFKVTKEKLESAHDDMMEWMRDYSEKFPYGEKAPTTAEELDQKTEVLKQEVEEIKRLKIDTDNAIAYAQKLLQQVVKNEYQ
ncbi:MAG: hypothetical protein WBG46_16005 [Nonlabens sp.]